MGDKMVHVPGLGINYLELPDQSDRIIAELFGMCQRATIAEFPEYFPQLTTYLWISCDVQGSTWLSTISLSMASSNGGKNSWWKCLAGWPSVVKSAATPSSSIGLAPYTVHIHSSTSSRLLSISALCFPHMAASFTHLRLAFILEFLRVCILLRYLISGNLIFYFRAFTLISFQINRILSIKRPLVWLLVDHDLIEQQLKRSFLSFPCFPFGSEWSPHCIHCVHFRSSLFSF